MSFHGRLAKWLNTSAESGRLEALPATIHDLEQQQGNKMSEDKFRVCITVLLTFLVFGILAVGYQLTEIGHQFAENGRYEPFDFRTQHSPDGKIHYSPGSFEILDTRTGEVIQKRR